MSFLACLPLSEADLPAVLSLDQRCLGGLWTYSGYQKELDSDCSDLLILVSAPMPERLKQRLLIGQKVSEQALPDALAAKVPVGVSTPEEVPEEILEEVPEEILEEVPEEISAAKGSVTLLGIGCLWAILDEAHITTLAIEPACQGQKLGQLLLSDLLLCGRQRNLTRATLEVRASNDRALKLYHKFGFQEAGERKRYYSDGENARILWKSGLEHEDYLEQIVQFRNDAIEHLSSIDYHCLT